MARTAKKIKHDGFRILAELGPSGVKLITRKGFDLAERFPLAVAAIAALPARSCSSVWCGAPVLQNMPMVSKR